MSTVLANESRRPERVTPKRRKPVKRAQRQQTPLLQRWVLRHGVPLLSFPRPFVPEHGRQVWIPCWIALVEAATNRAFRISPHALGEPCVPLISLSKIAGEGVARAGTGGCAGYGFGLRAHGRFRCPVVQHYHTEGYLGVPLKGDKGIVVKSVPWDRESQCICLLASEARRQHQALWRRTAQSKRVTFHYSSQRAMTSLSWS